MAYGIVFPLLILAAGIFLELILSRALSPRAKGQLAFLSSLIAFLGSLYFLPSTLAGRVLRLELFSWDGPSPLYYRWDGLALLFILMATGIGSAILLYCIQYMEEEKEGVTRFYALMLLFIGGLTHLVSTANFLLFYLSWEVIGLCSYFLVGFWYRQPAAANGARKVLVFTHLAGYGLLAAIILLYLKTGSWLMINPARSASISSGVFLLLLVAAMAKSVIFPLHTWIPEAMQAPTPVSALLHSACYVKAGVFLIARLYSFGAWPPYGRLLVIALGCATMLVGALFALKQNDLKRLLAFSTISQIGYIVTALGIGGGLGVAAALFYTVSHGLFKGALFLAAGSVQKAAGTRDLRELGGLARSMPVTAAVWITAAAAIVGVPLTNGFIAKWLFFDAALEAHYPIVVFIAWLVSALTAIYFLKATVSVFFAASPPRLQNRVLTEAPPTMRGGMISLAVLCLLFGLAPQLLLSAVVAPAVKSLNLPWTLTVSWLGVQTTTAGIHLSLGAALAVAALLAGIGIYKIWRALFASSARDVNVFTGGDALPESEAAVGAVDFTEVAASAFGPIYRRVDPDSIYLWLWNKIRNGAAIAEREFSQPLEAQPILVSLIMILITMILFITL